MRWASHSERQTPRLRYLACRRRQQQPTSAPAELRIRHSCSKEQGAARLADTLERFLVGQSSLGVFRPDCRGRSWALTRTAPSLIALPEVDRAPPTPASADGRAAGQIASERGDRQQEKQKPAEASQMAARSAMTRTAGATEANDRDHSARLVSWGPGAPQLKLEGSAILGKREAVLIVGRVRVFVFRDDDRTLPARVEAGRVGH